MIVSYEGMKNRYRPSLIFTHAAETTVCEIELSLVLDKKLAPYYCTHVWNKQKYFSRHLSNSSTFWKPGTDEANSFQLHFQT